jgi:hypothetical protein
MSVIHVCHMSHPHMQALPLGSHDKCCVSVSVGNVMSDVCEMKFSMICAPAHTDFPATPRRAIDVDNDAFHDTAYIRDVGARVSKSLRLMRDEMTPPAAVGRIVVLVPLKFFYTWTLSCSGARSGALNGNPDLPSPLMDLTNPAFSPSVLIRQHVFFVVVHFYTSPSVFLLTRGSVFFKQLSFVCRLSLQLRRTPPDLIIYLRTVTVW